MKKAYIDTDNLNTVGECLEQLVVAEETQLSIEHQLSQSDYSSEWSEWRRKAEIALRTVKAKRRIITAKLSVLRQQEKVRNIQLHQQHSDYFIDELRRIVTPSSFERCARRATERLESTNG